jgi:hypothetical protein
MNKIRNILVTTIFVIPTFNLTATPLENTEAVARFDPWGGDRTGQVRSLLDKRVEAAVTVALVSGAVRAVKSLSISSRIALN